LPEVPLTYTAWGATERAAWQPAKVEEHLKFWRPRLTDLPRLWRSDNSGPLKRWIAGLPTEIAEASRETAKRHGVTLFSTLLTAFQIALAKWTGEHDVIVGTPVANRTKQNVRETMGYFAGVVPLRGRVDPSRSFSQALQSAHSETIDSFAHAMPFAELTKGIGESQELGRNPIFQVRFALQNHPIPDVAVPGLSARLRMRSTGTPRLDLGCEITEIGDTFEVVWLYRTNLFSDADLRELDRLYQRVLEISCRNAESRLSSASV
jgi:non-ribosomal peptide synthetase component F